MFNSVKCILCKSKMILMKTRPFLVILLLVPCSTGNDVTEDDTANSTQPTKPVTESNEEVPSVTNSIANDYPANFLPSRPNFGFENSPPNALQAFLSQLFRPTKNTGKTYGPNVIAIIGDKPYISMEIFHKFTPFRWLMNVLQGKIQDICGQLVPTSQDDFPLSNSPNTLQQVLADNQKPLNRKPHIPRPVRIYDVPVGYRMRI